MKIFLDTNIFPEFIDRRVTTGSGHFVTVTKYPAPDLTRLTNNRFPDVIRMHSHISKGRNYNCVLPDAIVHLIVVADYFGAMGIFALIHI